ncbi:AlbA family DNA-binding domain-containing protein [Paraburkholderia megapolitana]|uniref:AlbA family DNA-binding domain-containing protein n=1 Tax=Paraburkholderia megapolitana TaxID=420953 RepID=UPI0038BD3977
MIDLPLDTITAETLAALVAEQREESRTLDFKRQPDKDLTRIAAEVCAMANGAGGDLVFGIDELRVEGEQTGRAGKLLGLDSAARDTTIRTIESALRDKIEPVIPAAGRHLHPVDLDGGRYVLILRVAASLNGPHRLKPREGHGEFYIRNARGKEPMDMHEIRNAFLYSDTLLDRAIAFRDRRLDALLDGRAPVAVAAAPRFVVHVVPLQALTTRQTFPVDQMFALKTRLMQARPFGRVLLDAMPNYEGVLCHSVVAGDRGAPAYVQLFRDGCMEFVGTNSLPDLLDGRQVVPVGQAESYFLSPDYPTIYETMRALDIVPPALIFVSWVHSRDFAVRLPFNPIVQQPRAFTPAADQFHQDCTLPAHLNHLVGPPAWLDSFEPTLEANGMPRRLARMRPAFDVIWNAAGRLGSETASGAG